jgi:hypothetical protein
MSCADRDRTKVIWRGPNSPSRAVAHELSTTRRTIEHWEVRDAIHDIKMGNGLRPSDSVIIHDNGDVHEADSGDYIGNICDDI